MFFYRRVFVGRVFNIISWTVIGVVVSWTIAFFFANVFACGTHPSNFWGTITVINTKCVKTRNLAVGFAMSDAIVDVAIILIPPFWVSIHVTSFMQHGTQIYANHHCPLALAATDATSPENIPSASVPRWFVVSPSAYQYRLIKHEPFG